MNSLALTDHGNLHGALEFYKKARDVGINPIIGYEAYIAPGSRFEKKDAANSKEASYHLTLLAQNRTGFKNLVKLASGNHSPRQVVAAQLVLHGGTAGLRNQILDDVLHEAHLQPLVSHMLCRHRPGGFAGPRQDRLADLLELPRDGAVRAVVLDEAAGGGRQSSA